MLDPSRAPTVERYIIEGALVEDFAGKLVALPKGVALVVRSDDRAPEHVVFIEPPFVADLKPGEMRRLLTRVRARKLVQM